MLLEATSSLFARVFGDWLHELLRRRRRLPWRSITKVSQRLSHVIHLASERVQGDSDVLSHLVEANPGLTLVQIEKARTGAAEPTIELVKQVCDALGASYQYIWHGKGTPFKPRDEDHVPVRQLLNLFREPGVRTIWFVRAKRYPHVSFVALQYDAFKFRVLPHVFHVSAENGNGGAAALSELAYLGESYQKAHLYEVVAWGLEVAPRVADGVLEGKLHGSALLQRGFKRSHWWDDLADVEHKRPCAKEYRSRYDQEFFNAQKLIAWARQDRPKS